MTKHESHEVNDVAVIQALIGTLADANGIKAANARRALVDIGEPAAPALVKALASPSHQVRWEAAIALRDMARRLENVKRKSTLKKRAIPAMVGALEDEHFDVRWIASEGLIALGQGSVEPLLRALMHRPHSVWLREGAHHVLYDLARQDVTTGHLGPVLTALEGVEPTVEVPWAAKHALDALTDQSG